MYTYYFLSLSLVDKKMNEMVKDMINEKKPKGSDNKKDTPTTTTPTTPSQPKNTPVQVNSSMEDALKKGKEGLKHTETVERHLPVVGMGGSGKGRGQQYNISDDQEKKEYFDKEEELNQKVKKVVEWVKASKHPIIFTGAGISTR